MSNIDLAHPVKTSVKEIIQIWNPFNRNLWVTMNSPITRFEIAEVLQKDDLISPEVPVKMNLIWDISSRSEHIKRIAWFVKYYDEKYSIEIDGIPGYCGFTILDGNHRLAAVIYLEKPYIMAQMSGSIDIINKFLYDFN